MKIGWGLPGRLLEAAPLCVLFLATKYSNPTQKTTIHKHTMPKRQAGSTQHVNPPKRRKISGDEVLKAAKNGDTMGVKAALEKLSDAAHEACKGNHHACLTLLLPCFETTQVGFGILLSECVHANHVACTEVLLQHWKSVCNNAAFVRLGSIAFVCPAMWSDPAVCRVLIDAGADIETKDEKGRSPLHCACKRGALDVVKMLIEAGARLATKDENERSPLHYACESGALDVVKMLLEAGAGVRDTDYNDRKCLALAAMFGRTETVRYLVGLPEVDVNHRDTVNKTALRCAVDQKHKDVVQVLIAAGADVNIRSNLGRSPLYAACETGALDIVKMLVRAGAGVRDTDNNGDTCLTRAADSGRTEIVRYLVGLPDVDVNRQDVENNSALHCAVISRQTDIVQVLIAAGVNIATRNNNGLPLHSACYGPGVVKMLVEAGADLSARDNKGRTCLILSAFLGHTGTVRYLVGLPQVELNDRGAYGKTALQCAVEKNHQDIMQVLIAAGADIDTKDKDGSTPLLTACESGLLHVVKRLVEAGAGVRVTDNQGDTCLTLAAYYGRTKVVRYLVGLPEVDVNHRADDNKNALQCAVEQKHNAVVQVLINAGLHVGLGGTSRDE